MMEECVAEWNGHTFNQNMPEDLVLFFLPIPNTFAMKGSNFILENSNIPKINK